MKDGKFQNPEPVIIELIRAGLIKLPLPTKFLGGQVVSQDDVIKETARVHALYLRYLRSELAKDDHTGDR